MNSKIMYDLILDIKIFKKQNIYLIFRLQAFLRIQKTKAKYRNTHTSFDCKSTQQKSFAVEVCIFIETFCYSLLYSEEGLCPKYDIHVWFLEYLHIEDKAIHYFASE